MGVNEEGEFVVKAKVSDFNVSGILLETSLMNDFPPYFVAPEVMSGGVCR